MLPAAPRTRHRGRACRNQFRVGGLPYLPSNVAIQISADVVATLK
jgi:hypothetical protein